MEEKLGHHGCLSILLILVIIGLLLLLLFPFFLRSFTVIIVIKNGGEVRGPSSTLSFNERQVINNHVDLQSTTLKQRQTDTLDCHI
jgi:hypothetical protein